MRAASPCTKPVTSSTNSMRKTIAVEDVGEVALVLTVGVGGVRSITRLPVAEASFPSVSVAVAANVKLPSFRSAGTVAVHEFPLTVALNVCVPTVTLTVAVDSPTVPVSTGVRSFVVRLFAVTVGFNTVVAHRYVPLCLVIGCSSRCRSTRRVARIS